MTTPKDLQSAPVPKNRALPYLIGIPVGMYAGAFAAMVMGLVSTWIGAFVIPTFVIVWVLASRFIIRRVQGFDEQRRRELAGPAG